MCAVERDGRLLTVDYRRGCQAEGCLTYED
jgi:hypothetical protein